MNIRKIALSSAAAIGLVAALGVTSASAHSRHPATASENAQTDQLTTPTPAPSTNDMKAPDNSAPTAANQDPAAPQPASGIAPKTPQ